MGAKSTKPTKPVTSEPIPSNAQECRHKMRSAAAECLDAVEAGTVTELLVDAFGVKTAHAWLFCPESSRALLEAVEQLGRRAAAARTRLADGNTPMSDMHRWTDEVDQCRRVVPELRARLNAELG